MNNREVRSAKKQNSGPFLQALFVLDARKCKSRVRWQRTCGRRPMALRKAVSAAWQSGAPPKPWLCMAPRAYSDCSRRWVRQVGGREGEKEMRGWQQI